MGTGSTATAWIRTTILFFVGINYGIASRPGLIQTEIAVLVLVSLFVIMGVSFLFGIFDTYTATLDRAHDIAIMKAFGATSTPIVNLLAQESFTSLLLYAA